MLVGVRMVEAEVGGVWLYIMGRWELFLWGMFALRLGWGMFAVEGPMVRKGLRIFLIAFLMRLKRACA
jgi:hypothetical protein